MSGGLEVLRVQQALGVTAQTAKLALALMEREGQIVTSSALAVAIHSGKSGSAASSAQVRKCALFLREGLAKLGCRDAIEGVFGVGYRLSALGGGAVREQVTSVPEPQGGGCSGTTLTAPRPGASRTPLISKEQASNAAWGAAQAWPVAVAVASEATGVPVEAITAKTRRSQRRPEVVTKARALAICLAVIGGAAPRKALARMTGFDLSFIKDLLTAQVGERECPHTDAELERLEAEVLRRLEAAHAGLKTRVAA